MLTENEIAQPADDNNTYQLVQASSGKRFANYLIDMVFFYLVVIFWIIILSLVYPSIQDSFDENDNLFGAFADRIIGLLLYALLMSLVEAIFRGKSVGKLITGTKAVNEDGSDISFSTAFARGFSRAVPFNAFSALGHPCYPWHDKWTRTFVIDEKANRLYNKQLKSIQ